MTCDDLVCSDDKLVCEETQTPEGTLARCVVSIPDSCDELTCDEGYTCEVRERARDGVKVARCIVIRTGDTNPRRGATCLEVLCNEDEVCMMLDDGTARCTKPPPPTDCSQLECGPSMLCLPTSNGNRVRCVLDKGTLSLSYEYTLTVGKVDNLQLCMLANCWGSQEEFQHVLYTCSSLC